MKRVHFRSTPFGVVVSESGPAPLVAELKGDEAEQFRLESAKTISVQATTESVKR